MLYRALLDDGNSKENFTIVYQKCPIFILHLSNVFFFFFVSKFTYSFCQGDSILRFIEHCFYHGGIIQILPPDFYSLRCDTSCLPQGVIALMTLDKKTTWFPAANSANSTLTISPSDSDVP